VILIGLASALVIFGSAAALTAAAGGPAGTVAAANDGPADSSSGPHLFEVGRPFPSIVLPAAADGRPLSAADFRGRKTILHVFASW
jgi:hypothetical protein